MNKNTLQNHFIKCFIFLFARGSLKTKIETTEQKHFTKLFYKVFYKKTRELAK